MQFPDALKLLLDGHRIKIVKHGNGGRIMPTALEYFPERPATDLEINASNGVLLPGAILAANVRVITD